MEFIHVDITLVGIGRFNQLKTEAGYNPYRKAANNSDSWQFVVVPSCMTLSKSIPQKSVKDLSERDRGRKCVGGNKFLMKDALDQIGMSPHSRKKTSDPNVI